MERCRIGVIGLLALLAGVSTPRSSVLAQTTEPFDGGTTVRLANLEGQFKSVAAGIAPSVVAITGSPRVTDSDEALRADGLNEDKLEGWLNRTSRTVGAGFVIDSEGYILTNEHVVAQADQLWISTDDQKLYPAVVVGSDPRADLAVLKVPTRALKAVKFSLKPVERGGWTIAIGNPYGLAMGGQMSMSIGIVSATDRSLTKLSTIEQRLYTNLIQTTAEINPGNSGGPLFNLDGEVIGVCTAVVMPSKSANGIGFAFPITPQLLGAVEELKQGREVKYAYLGVMVSTLTPDERRAGQINAEIGVRIDTVEANSPAAVATLKVGDFILAIDDAPVSGSDDFIRRIGRSPIDGPTKLNVRREGKPMSLVVNLRERELPSVAVNSRNQRLRWRGMLLGPIPTNWDFAPSKRPSAGLMVLGVDPGGPMGKTVQSGAIITAVAGKPVNSIPELQEILNDTPAELCKVEIAPIARDVVVSGE